jgi:hybrid cluster-associated redox disulfide protein
VKLVNKDMKIEEILKENPDAGLIMQKAGLHCVGCMAAMFETFEQGCKAHGMDDEAIDKLIEEINN